MVLAGFVWFWVVPCFSNDVFEVSSSLMSFVSEIQHFDFPNCHLA